MTDNNTIDRELGWDDEISSDGPTFTTLPAGEYPFEVLGMERERYAGGEKLTPCWKAVIEIRVDGGTCGSTTIKENLFLHTKTEGILCAFFTSIGARKHGEKLKMDWSRVIGSKGRVKLGIRSYDKDGEARTINQVKQWLEPADASTACYTPGTF